MATQKRLEKIVRENAFDEKKQRPGLKFNPGLALIGLRTTGPLAVRPKLDQELIQRSEQLSCDHMQRRFHRPVSLKTNFPANFDYEILLTNQKAKTGDYKIV